VDRGDLLVGEVAEVASCDLVHRPQLASAEWRARTQQGAERLELVGGRDREVGRVKPRFDVGAPQLRPVALGAVGGSS
jgi:hypothetical protein